MFKKLRREFCGAVAKKSEINLYRRIDTISLGSYEQKKYQSNNKIKRKCLVDFSHYFYPKWNVKSKLFVNKFDRDTEIHAFAPNLFFVWPSLRVIFGQILMAISGKQKCLSKAFGFRKNLKPAFIKLTNLSRDIKWARDELRLVESKSDILEINIEGIVIGDLIYDTYLKWFKKPTVNQKDIRLLFLLIIARTYTENCKKIFRENQYTDVLLTHSVYIAFGILARVALDSGASVKVIQNVRGKTHRELTKNHPYQAECFAEYPSVLKGIKANELISLRAKAELELNSRLKGDVSAINYMRNSAYNTGTQPPNFSNIDPYPGRPRVFIPLHCFFDSPHIYRWILFPDFYEWLDCILPYLLENKINVYLKPHPNGIEGNSMIVEQLKEKYKDVQLIDAATDNSSLRPRHFDAVLTVYGTIAHEFAYKGFQVINAGDNPHIGFSFSLTPNSVSEYLSAIKGILFKEKKIEISNQEIFDFYVAHFLLARDLVTAPLEEFESSLPINSSIEKVNAYLLSDSKLKELINCIPSDL
ncbi:hypothetical protein [Pseudidiomarina sp. CB1]|uniref:hypothetical protein n=1 Tax=Pseudidiomarina sp. CB1 TaxID=2972484 RepID=UPI002163E09A|nr:hypothetical protein [Pseudidiomarina sp. CB1]